MIVVIKRRFTSANEKRLLEKQGELVKAHNKGLLGKHWYTEDKTGSQTGTKGKGYLSPLRNRVKI